MKKLAGFLIIITLISVACTKKIEIEKAPLPSTAMLGGFMVDPQTTWSKFTSTQLYQDFKKLELWNDPGIKKYVDPDEESGDAAEKKSIDSEITIDALMLLCGKRIDFAVVPGSPQPGAILFSDLGIQATALKAAALIQEKFGDFSSQKEMYEKTEIVSCSHEKKGQFSYAFIDRYMFLATDAQLIKTSIDIMNKKTTGMLDDALYMEAQASFKDIPNFFYIDIPDASATLNQMLPGNDIAGKAAEMRYFAAGFNWNEKGLEGATQLAGTNKEVFNKYFGPADEIGSVVSWIPENAMIVGANTLKLNEMMPKAEQAPADEDIPSGTALGLSMLNSVFEVAGKDTIEKLIPYFKPGMFFCIQDLNTQGMFPIPEIVLGIKISDEKAVAGLMKDIEKTLSENLDKPYMQFVSNTVEEKEFRNVPLPLGPNLSPGYCISDGFLLIAISNSAMQNTLAANNGKISSLTKSAKFNQLSANIFDKSVGFQYVNSEAIFMKLHDLVNNYRMFFPEDINPDHVKDSLKSLSLFQGYFISAHSVEASMKNDARFMIK